MAVGMCVASFVLPIANIIVSYCCPSTLVAVNWVLTPSNFLFYQGLGCLVTTFYGVAYFASVMWASKRRSTVSSSTSWIELVSFLAWIISDVFNALWSVVGIPIVIANLVNTDQALSIVTLTLLLNQAFLLCLTFTDIILLHTWVLPQCIKHFIFRKPSVFVQIRK